MLGINDPDVAKATQKARDNKSATNDPADVDMGGKKSSDPPPISTSMSTRLAASYSKG
jgi:hypothetical protein